MTDPSPPAPRLRDQYASNATANAHDLAQADARYRALIDRRERLIERMSFGLIALHAGSIAALFAGWKQLRELGLSPEAAAYVCLASLIGIALAGIAVFTEYLNVTEMAGEEVRRLSFYRRTEMILDMRPTQDAVDRLGQQIEDLDKHRPADFKFSRSGLISFHVSGGLWLGGAVAIIYEVIWAVLT